MPIIDASFETFVTVPVSRPHHVPSHRTASFLGLLIGTVIMLKFVIEIGLGVLQKSLNVSKQLIDSRICQEPGDDDFDIKEGTLSYLI